MPPRPLPYHPKHRKRRKGKQVSNVAPQAAGCQRAELIIYEDGTVERYDPEKAKLC